MEPYQATRSFPLPTGDAGVAFTLTHLRSFVVQSQSSELAHAAVQEALESTPEKSPGLEAAAILGWVRERYHYIQDPVEVELVHDPRYLLRQIQTQGYFMGDCDDAAVLLAALLETAGYSTRFLVQGEPGESFSHVLIEAELAGAWTPIDLTNRSAQIGWKPPTLGREARERRLGMLGQIPEWGTPATPGANEPEFFPDRIRNPRYGAWLLTQGPLLYALEGEIKMLGQNGDNLESMILASIEGVGGTGGGYDQGQPENGSFSATDSSASSWLSGLFSKETLQSALAIAERVGVYKPIVGYNADGSPIYGSTIPATGTQAAYSSLTQITGGLPVWLWVLLGVGTVVVLSKRKR